eukprot:XP_015570475.1 protein FRIGIDA-ESSENTIAL 1 isoform X1 [Ricinus communis]
MPPPSSAPRRSFDDDSVLSSSDHDDGVEEEEEEEIEEEEYEEIEVEEEEEIIEEIEVEEDEEEEEEEAEEEEEQPLDSSNQKSSDVRQPVEFERDGGQHESRSTAGNSELGLLSNSLLEDNAGNSKFSGPLNEPFTRQQESYVNYEGCKYLKSGEHLTTNGENRSQDSGVKKDFDIFLIKCNSKECSQPHCDSKAPLCNSEIKVPGTTNLIRTTENELPNDSVIKDDCNIETNAILDASIEVMQSENDKRQTASRCSLVQYFLSYFQACSLTLPNLSFSALTENTNSYILLITRFSRTRSLSPSSELKDPYKRPAVVCDFFAKGWCIRGSSCMFLHVNDKADNAKGQLEGDAAATDFSKGDQFSEERSLALKDGEIGRLHQLDDKHTSSSLQREDLSRRVHPDTLQFPSSKGDPRFSFPLKDAATENLRQNWLATDYRSYASPINSGSSPSFQKSLLPEHRSSSGSVVTSSNHCNGNPSSYLGSLENPTYVRGHCLQASRLDGSLSSSQMLLSHQVSAQTGPLFSYNSSLSTSPLGSQKLFEHDRSYRASRSSSLLQSASPLSGSQRENLPLTNVFADPLHYAEHKAEISSNDWEPSTPFRPSFLLTPTIASSPGSQYDPLRDSIDLPTTGYRVPFKFCFLSQGTSSLNMSHQPGNRDSLASQALGLECNDDKCNASFYSRYHENVVDKNCYTLRKDISVSGAVTGGSCVVNGKKAKEENASSTGHSKDVLNTSDIEVDRDSRNLNDGPKCKKDFKVDKGRQNNEMEVDQKTDGESRALRHFRAALVDFVKELLKPTWREGHLSKDAHNTIVKKAVDKVLTTLHPLQIPATMEITKQYLSSSRTKIAKLVEGYCTKYGKT